jgi:hypothetical protein
MTLYPIQRMKSEAPLVAVFAVFSIFMSLFLFPKLLFFSFLIFPIMALIYLGLRASKLGFFGKSCFVMTDEEGIRFAFTVFSTPKFLKWDQIQTVNFQLYEINFKLKESGEVICFETSYFAEANDVEAFKQVVQTHCTMV